MKGFLIFAKMRAPNRSETDVEKMYCTFFEQGGYEAMKFFKTTDGQIVINDSTAGTELIPNTVDAAYEKHVPVIEHHGDSVLIKVGSVAHPMLDVHWIEWIVLETDTGYQKKELKPGDAPEACFAVTEPVVAAYEYCNLHGLWMAKA